MERPDLDHKQGEAGEGWWALHLAWRLPASPAFRALCADMPADDGYVPPFGTWELRRSSEVGLDSAALEEAVAWATDTAHSGMGPDLQRDLKLFVAGEPENTIVGPVMNRGPQAGIVVKDGYVVRTWAWT